MAVYWNLGLRTETEAAALACIEFFRQKRLVLDAIQVALEFHHGAIPGGWFAGVCPCGVSISGSSDERLIGDETLLRIARIFDAWLLEAPRSKQGILAKKQRMLSVTASGTCV